MQILNSLKRNMNKIVIGYVAAVIIYQVLCLIAPIKAFLYDTHLNGISSMLALIGLCFWVWDILDERIFLKAKYSYLLIATLTVLIISSIVYINYGISKSLKVLIWQIVQMLLIYPACKRIPKDSLKKLICTIHKGMSILFVPAAIVSICQFIIYNGYYIEISGGEVRQGFQEGRLFGMFSDIYFASVFLLIMITASIYYAVITSNKFLRIAYICESVIFFIYLVLSRTRSTMLGLLFSVLVFAIVYFRYFFDNKSRIKISWVKNLLCVVLVLLSVISTRLVWNMTDKGFQQLQQLPFSNETTQGPVIIHKESATRTDVSQKNISNHRFEIWSDYINVTSSNLKSIILGNSPGNYMTVIKELHPDIYIVNYIYNNYPGMYEKGLIYDVHNAYLSIYAESGIIGTLVFGAFLVSCVFSISKRLLKKVKNLSPALIATSIMIVSIMISAFFDSDLFFRCTSTSVLFWFIMGINMNILDSKDKA